ncbi:hypothetical protein CHU92_11260 [Flavobacterium cyanobacteriorum]|uniref:Uncharacterized protein n=1 Tax=Flavobacterium cyanobacteriorum TaxID=2022802 RepID=A0A255Z2D8_9FLAO|nr:hypothetical protein [Flavobacterium cyanobacteriorum]OYQ35084.1 hypothetical protein CHU92_11260 [Flavobacterium cyanobacteriorum]
MPRIKEEEFKDITKVDFDGQTYYSVAEAQEYLKTDLSALEAITLPIKGTATKCATFEKIMDYKHQNRELSDFDKKIIQGLNFNPRKK